jgi:uncharacterized membrane protein
MKDPDSDRLTPADAWLETGLEERVGGLAPPDLCADILARAGGDERPSTERVPERRRPLPSPLAAAALVAVGLAVLLGVRWLKGTGEGTTGAGADPGRAVRVLYVEDVPRWEYRYLKNALLRDRSVALQAFLCAVDADFAQEHSEGRTALSELPRARDELERYDVVLLGDVGPESLGASAEERDAWFAVLGDFVADGGGLGVLCGERAMPEHYRGTALEALLPVDLPPRQTAEGWVPVDGGVTPLLAPGAEAHPAVLLADDPEDNVRIWHGGFPPFRRYRPLGQPRRGSMVLLSDPGPERRPFAAVGSHGRGRTFILATDETWRLRDPHGERYHARLWRNVLRWLAGRE